MQINDSTKHYAKNSTVSNGRREAYYYTRLVTVPTDPLTTLKFLSEWAKCQPGNTQNGGTVLLIANLMADSESGSPHIVAGQLIIS